MAPYDSELTSYILNDPNLSVDDQRITFGMPNLEQRPNCNELFEIEWSIPETIQECYDVSDSGDEITFPSLQRSCDFQVGSYTIKYRAYTSTVPEPLEESL